MLTGQKIKECVRNGTIRIDPFILEHVGANSIDVCLGDVLLEVTSERLDFRLPYDTITHHIPPEGFELKAMTPYLGVTRETTSTDLYVPSYEGRSTVGRYFVISHFTAGYGDLGFSGHWTLEICALLRTRVYAGMRIGQIHFSAPDGPLETVYKGGYNNNPKATPYPQAGRPNNF